MCVTFFPILPLLIFLSAQILLKPAAAAVETLKCDVCISSQLLKSLPLSPSVPFLSFPFFLSFFLSLSIHGWAPQSLQTPWETGKTLLAGSWNMTLWYSPGWEWVCSNVTYQSEKRKRRREEEGGKRTNEKINTKAALQRLAQEANICSGVMERSWSIMEIIHPPPHVNSVSGNSCTLAAHNLSSMQSCCCCCCCWTGFSKMTMRTHTPKKKKKKSTSNRWNPKINPP